MNDRKPPVNFSAHVSQQDFDRYRDLVSRKETGEKLSSADHSFMLALLLRPSRSDGFVSLKDELTAGQIAAGIQGTMASDFVEIFLGAHTDTHLLLHFSTRTIALGPGRLLAFDLTAETVSVQLRGESDVRLFAFSEIHLNVAAYSDPKTVNDFLLATFWEAKASRKCLEMVVGHAYACLAPEDIDAFSKVVNVSERDVASLMPLSLSEAEVKRHICSIVGNPFVRKDWGGESCDIACELEFRRRRVLAAFALKGKAYANKTLRIADLGKNGDQIVRIFALKAQIFVVQSNGAIDESIYSHVQAQVAEKILTGQPVYYMVLDGMQTARILRAYDKI